MQNFNEIDITSLFQKWCITFTLIEETRFGKEDIFVYLEALIIGRYFFGVTSL